MNQRECDPPSHVAAVRVNASAANPDRLSGLGSANVADSVTTSPSQRNLRMNVNNITVEAKFRTLGLAFALIACAALASGCSQGFANTARVVRADSGQLTVVEENGVNEHTHAVAPDAKVVLDGQAVRVEELDSGDAVKLTLAPNQVGVQVIKRIEAKSKERVEAEKAHDVRTAPLIDPPAAPIEPLVDEHLAEPKQPAVARNQSDDESSNDDHQPLVPEDETGTGQAAAAPPNADPHAARAANPDVEMAEDAFAGTIIGIDHEQFVMLSDSDDELTFQVDGGTVYTLNGYEATLDQLMVGYPVTVTAERNGDDYVARIVDAISQF